MSSWRSWLSWLVWLVPLGVWIWATTATGAPVAAWRYAGYVVVGVFLPGALVARVCLGHQRRSWLEDLGLGAPIGLAYELVGWALFTAAGLQRYLVVWPLVLIATFAAVGDLRRAVLRRTDVRLPLAWSLSLALIATLALVSVQGVVNSLAMPPRHNAIYPDMLWHLSLINELVRSVPPQVPQVAGETLRYHWFADAHLAAAADISGVDPRWILFRFWYAPMVLAGVGVVAAIARMLTRAWWAAPLAVFLAFFGRADPWPDQLAAGHGAAMVAVYSPSQTIGTVASLGAAGLLIAVLFRRAPVAAWVPAGLLLVYCAGIKPTALPMLIGGTAMAAVQLACSRRRVPWRVVGVGAASTAVFGIAALTVIGSTGGTQARLFASLRYRPGYQAATGDDQAFGTGGGVVAGLAHPTTAALVWATATLVGLLLSQLGTLITVVALFLPRTRRDPVIWWMSGPVIVSWLGYLMIDHPGNAQTYFLSGGTPFAALGACVVLASYARRCRGPTRRAWLVGGALGGAAVVYVIRGLMGNLRGAQTTVTAAVGWPVLALTLMLLVALAWTLWWRRRRPERRELVTAGLLALCVGTLLSGWRPQDVPAAFARIAEPAPREKRYLLLDEEIAAALWLRTQVPARAVVATTTVCLPTVRRPPCNPRGYLVSGIGGHRTLLEGWAYTAESLAGIGPGSTFQQAANPWPDRLRLSQQAVASPTPQVLAELRRQKVTWIFADSRSIQPDQSALDSLVNSGQLIQHFQNARVRIYQIPP